MEKNRIIMMIILGFMSIGTAGCGSADMSPRAIQPEVDTCEVCNMSIAHDEFAAQAVTEKGDHLMFDDIGCLVQYEGTKEIGAHYIKEHATNEWIDADKALYVYHKDFWTPMSYGVLAFTTREDAEAFIEQEGKGELLKAGDLKEHEWGVHSHEE
ncbi:nitrous oxide reductase accessory protein NosL [Rossellomorea oryzaecorticis]|uniref:Nitrous oxide reductase accessory protein NosL n=1 Tax=Rossellomorea oryzaecorticis TaxID=1396505 RepID=A0ABU9K8H6_9BACI